jgi:hypothetical protein
MTRPGFVIVWLVLALVSAPARRVLAQAPAPVDVRAPDSCSAWAQQAPASADVVVVIENAAKLRATPVGLVLRDLVSRAGLLAETRTSWEALAKTLGWTRDETFDRLIGSRVMVVVSGVTGDDPAAPPAQWAVLSRVDKTTEARLVERLKAAPRGVAAGHQLLTVEHGSYELAIEQARPGAKEASPVMVLGPRDRHELFDRVLRALDDAPAPGELALSSTGASASLDDIGGGDAIVLVRMDPSAQANAKAAADAWSAHAALALRADDAGLGVRCVVCDPSAGHLLDAGGPGGVGGAGGPAIDLDANFTGALVVVVEHPSMKDSLKPGAPLATALAAVRMPEPLQRALAGGQMVLVRSCAEPPGIAAGVGVRLADPTAAVIDADAFMAGLVNLIEGPRRPDGGAQAVNFAGVAPRAMRTVRIDAWSGLPGINWPPVWMCWSLAPGEAIDQPEAAAAGPGWWVVGAAGGQPGEVGAGPDLASELVAQLRAGAPANEAGRVLSQGVVRPAALARAVWPGVPDIVDWREALGRVDLVRWRFDAADGMRISGTVRVDVSPAGAAAPGGPGASSTPGADPAK